MPVEYRPARPEEMRKFIYSGHVGFGNSTADEAVDRGVDRAIARPEHTLCAFEDGEPVSKMATLPFVMRWNGRDVKCGGVTHVTTLPTHRRQGHLRELMTRGLAAMKEAGQPVGMLWASMAAIYQRFGWGIAFTERIYEFDPRHLRFADEIPVPGRMRMIAQGDAHPVLQPGYDRFAEPRTLMLRRDPEWWTSVVLRPWLPTASPWLISLYEENGDPLGYVIYGVEHRSPTHPLPDQQLNVVELAWTTPAAHRALVQYLAGHDLAYSVRMSRMPSDDPLFYQAQEPRLLGAMDWDGTLVRIVDVAGALESRGYDGAGRFTFSLTDDLCPWNTGAWELTADGGNATVRRTDLQPSLCLTPRVLAILASGHLSATTLAHIGLILNPDGQALRTADAIFRTAYAPFCADGF